MDKEERLSAKYRRFDCLLLYFLDDTYYDDRADIDTIKRFVSVPTFDKKYIQQTIEQGKEILQLQPFPAEWVQNTANKYPFNQSHETKLEDYYKWVEWIVMTLEAEAKKAGKI